MENIKGMLSTIQSGIGITDTDMWQRNLPQCVDARCIAVVVLWEYGMTDNQIAGIFKLTRQGVNKLRNSFVKRIKRKMFRDVYKESKIAIEQ